MEEEEDEEAQMEGDGTQENDEDMHENDAPPTAPSSSHVNEDNFQLMIGRMNSMATSIKNLTNLVTNRFSLYDTNFAHISKSLEDINERLWKDGI